MKAVKTLGLAMVAIVVVLAAASPAMAQTNVAIFNNAFGKGIGAGLVLIGAAMGFGRIGSAALESMARQPETAGRVQTAMIIIGALLEGATFFALIVCITINAA